MWYKGDVVTGTQDGYLVGVSKIVFVKFAIFYFIVHPQPYNTSFVIINVMLIPTKQFQINPDNAEVKWKIQCPQRASGGPCRILGLRVVGEFLFGIDLFGRLFKFQSGEFQWLLDSKSPEIAKLDPGFFNDLVVHEDVAYITDSFTLREDKKHQNLFQRFYSIEADGKVIAYNLKSGKAWVFADNLHIPTGVELHGNNKVLLVAESNMYRISELDLKTGKNIGIFSKSGTLGAVGGLRRSKEGGYWVAVSAGRTSRCHVSDLLAVSPFLRYLVTEYQRFYPLLGNLSKRCVEEPRFYKVDEEGHVTDVVSVGEDVTETSKAFSGVLELGNVVFVGAPSSKSIFRARLSGGM